MAHDEGAGSWVVGLTRSPSVDTFSVSREVSKLCKVAASKPGSLRETCRSSIISFCDVSTMGVASADVRTKRCTSFGQLH